MTVSPARRCGGKEGEGEMTDEQLETRKTACDEFLARQSDGILTVAIDTARLELRYIAEIERLREIVDRKENDAGILMACHDVIRDELARRQGRPSASLDSERLEQLAAAAREAAEKARATRL